MKLSDNLKENEHLARLSYLTVTNPKKHLGNGNYGATVQNEAGLSWDISYDVLDNECTSGTQYTTLIKVSQSELIEKLLDAGHHIFTANFHKKPDPKLAEKKLKDLYPNKGIKGVGIAKREDYNKTVSEVVKMLFEGEERTITARIISIDKLRGRLMVKDLYAAQGDDIRQIDPRTLNWLIIKNVRWEIK